MLLDFYSFKPKKPREINREVVVVVGLAEFYNTRAVRLAYSRAFLVETLHAEQNSEQDGVEC